MSVQDTATTTSHVNAPPIRNRDEVVDGLIPSGGVASGQFKGAFRSALETLSTAIFLVDRAGVIVFVSQAVESIFGYGGIELIGQPLEKLAPRPLRAKYRSYRIESLKRRKIVGGSRHELCGRCKDGSVIPIEVDIRLLDTADGLFMLGSVIDASMHKLQ